MSTQKLQHHKNVLDKLETQIKHELEEAKKLIPMYEHRSDGKTILRQIESKIKKSKQALIDIENGTYGICEISNELIPVGDLKSNPLLRRKFKYAIRSENQVHVFDYNSSPLWISKMKNAI